MDRWDNSPAEDGKELYLEQAERTLYKRFCAEVDAGDYGQAGEVLGLMERLSIV